MWVGFFILRLSAFSNFSAVSVGIRLQNGWATGRMDSCVHTTLEEILGTSSILWVSPPPHFQLFGLGTSVRATLMLLASLH